jgi:CHAT domain-containing protein
MPLMQTLYDGWLGPEHPSPAAALSAAPLTMMALQRLKEPQIWRALVVTGPDNG